LVWGYRGEVAVGTGAGGGCTTETAVEGALASYIHAMTGPSVSLFASGALDDFLGDSVKRLCADVAGQTEAYILGVSPEQYEAHLVSMSHVEPPIIDFEAVSAERREVTVPAPAAARPSRGRPVRAAR
jgi:hypothetical protein